jgi:hypothetical protein
MAQKIEYLLNTDPDWLDLNALADPERVMVRHGPDVYKREA